MVMVVVVAVVVVVTSHHIALLLIMMIIMQKYRFLVFILCHTHAPRFDVSLILLDLFKSFHWIRESRLHISSLANCLFNQTD